MSELTPVQLQGLQETANLMFHEGLELIKAVPQALKRAAKGRDEVIQNLRGRGATASEVELKDLLEAARRSHIELFEGTLDVAESVGKLPAAFAAAGKRGAAEAGRLASAQSADPRRALADAMASTAFDPVLKQFAVGVSALVLGHLIDAYTETSEGFLGHEAGSVKVGERLTRVAGAFLKDTAGLVLPPYVDTLREVYRQLTESQAQRDAAALASETGDRLFRLRRIQGELKTQSEHAQEVVQQNADIGTEAAFDEGRVIARVKGVLDDPSNQPS